MKKDTKDKIDEQMREMRVKKELLDQAWFITGTDTEIGKTYVSTRLLQALNNAGIYANGYKPVASGSAETPMGHKNPDAYQHLVHSFDALRYEEVNPYFFEAEEAPHILADQLNQPIDFDVMTHGLHHLMAKKCLTLVEGAGGWHTPLSLTKSYSDWVVENRLPVIVVVGLKLGVINHARLTFEAITNAGLEVTGWIANHLSDAPHLQHYITGIQSFTDIPMIGEVPYRESQPEVSVNQMFNLKSFT